VNSLLGKESMYKLRDEICSLLDKTISKKLVINFSLNASDKTHTPILISPVLFFIFRNCIMSSVDYAVLFMVK
jgi:hypothetical protein